MADLDTDPVDTARYAQMSVKSIDDSKQAFEVAIAQVENRLRQTITDLISPTIQRTTLLSGDIDDVKALVLQHTKQLQTIETQQFRSVEQVLTIAQFREDLSRWENQMRSVEVHVDEKLENMGMKLESFVYSLEQKESALHHLNRCNQRVSLDLSRLTDDLETQRPYVDDRFEEQSRKFNAFRTQVEVKFTSVDLRHDALSDELWCEETGLAKCGGELKKTNAALESLESAVDELLGSKAEAAQLDRLRSEVTVLVQESHSTISSLKTSVGTAVNHVKEHFRTASETIAAHNAAFVSEMRQDYQEELRAAAKLREEVQEFTAQVDKGMSVLNARVADADSKASTLASEVREEIVELSRLRKRDKASTDNEVKALKQRLGNVFDSSDAVKREMEHMHSIVDLVLESDGMQCCLDLQDSLDRRKIALMGTKDDHTALARTTHTEPQHPRPEHRMKIGAAPGKQPMRGAASGALSARSSNEPVVRVDLRCLGCSGQAPMVLSAFKIACLQWTSSPVAFKGTVRERDDLLSERTKLLDQARHLLHEGPRERGAGDGLVAAPGFDGFASPGFDMRAGSAGTRAGSAGTCGTAGSRVGTAGTAGTVTSRLRTAGGESAASTAASGREGGDALADFAALAATGGYACGKSSAGVKLPSMRTPSPLAVAAA